MSRTTSRPLTVLGLALVAVVFGCAQPSTDRGRATDTYGYQWAGAGEPANFGADYSMCRREVSSDPRMPSGPYAGVGPGAARADAASTRRLRACMEGRGWKTVER